MKSMKNLPEASPKALSEMIMAVPNRVVSMALSKKEAVQMTLFAMGAGESISQEEYPGDALYYVVEGTLLLEKQGTTQKLSKGACLAVAAGIPHSLAAPDGVKYLQIIF